ncbi:MAG: hypothetical protein ACLR6B_14430 [Blautia sp.]
MLQKAEEKKEKLGLELAAYYRNHQEKQGISSPVTLVDLWNWRPGKEGGELKLPVLVLRDGSLLPEGVLTVQLSDRTCYKKAGSETFTSCVKIGLIYSIGTKSATPCLQSGQMKSSGSTSPS